MQSEEVQRLKLALRRLASIDEEDAERFLLFVPPLPAGDAPALARLAAAAAVAHIEVPTKKESFATSFGRRHVSASSVTRDIQYRLALVFSCDSFERACSLVAVLTELEFQADPDEIAGLMLGSLEVVNQFRIFFRDLALRIDDRTPATGGNEVLPPLRQPVREKPAVREEPAALASLKAAIEAVMAARGPAGTESTEWRNRKVGQVLAWAAATAFGHLDGAQAKALFESGGSSFVPGGRTSRFRSRPNRNF